MNQILLEKQNIKDNVSLNSSLFGRENLQSISEERKNELASKYLKSRQKGRDRHHSYTKRRKEAGYNRMPSIWLKLPHATLLALARWMKNQEPERLIELMNDKD